MRKSGICVEAWDVHCLFALDGGGSVGAGRRDLRGNGAASSVERAGSGGAVNARIHGRKGPARARRRSHIESDVGLPLHVRGCVSGGMLETFFEQPTCESIHGRGGSLFLGRERCSM